ncbi:MAG TPA: hypothetical protein VGK31_07265 [Thermoanaerobaculia bacterium]|jgi:hypothetical protein
MEFNALVTLIIVAGFVVVGIAATLLFLTFRAFGTAKPGDIRHIVLLVATLAFVFLTCATLMIWVLVKK